MYILECFLGYQSYDPCQYVYLSFISRLNRQIEYLGRQFKPEVVDELIKYYGMNTAFISAVAQAHNQGKYLVVNMINICLCFIGYLTTNVATVLLFT